MSIEVIPVTRFFERWQFLHLPFRAYKDDPHWVSPLLYEHKNLLFRKKHAFWRHGHIAPFIALKNGRPVGRIAAVLDNAHNEFHNEKTGFFGFFEVLNAKEDPEGAREVTRSMFATVERWLKEKGCDTMRGPASPSSNYDWACLVEGHGARPVFLMPYNHPEYPALFEAQSMSKAMDVVSLFFEAPDMPDKARRVAAIAEKKGYKVRNLNVGDGFDGDTELILDVYNDAWEKNWGFIPMDRHEFMAQAQQLKTLALPSLVKIVEYKGEAVGFALSMPDYNVALRKMRGRVLPFGLFRMLSIKRNPQRVGIARVITLGVKQAHRLKGVDALLTVHSVQAGHDLGIHKADFGWVLETNKEAIQLFEHLGGRIYRRYRIYEKRLEGAKG